MAPGLGTGASPGLSPGTAGIRGSRSLAGKIRGPFVSLGGLSRPQTGALPVFAPLRLSDPRGTSQGRSTGMGEVWWSLSWPGLAFLFFSGLEIGRGKSPV